MKDTPIMYSFCRSICGEGIFFFWGGGGGEGSWMSHDLSQTTSAGQVSLRIDVYWYMHVHYCFCMLEILCGCENKAGCVLLIARHCTEHESFLFFFYFYSMSCLQKGLFQAPFTRRRCENDRYEIVPIRKEIFPDRPPVYTKTIRIRKLLKTIRRR